MTTWGRITTLTVFSALLVTTSTTQAQSTKPVLLKTPPDLVLKVERQSGNCPKTIGLWTAIRYYEGGGEHTVIADTWAMPYGAAKAQYASRAQLTSSTKKLVEYKAPLRTVYATCVGQAKASEDYPYQLQFGNGNVAFKVKLPPDTPANPSEIMEKSILGARPYVRWQIAD
jgi:hypothetical protein